MINFRKIFEGLRIVPKTTSTVSVAGDMDFDTSNNKLNLHNGTTASPVTTEAHAATLTNKTIDGDDNTVQDLSLTSLKTVLADANKFVSRDASGIVTSTIALPSGTIVGTTSTQTLTNKTIDGDDNTIQDLAVTSLKTVIGNASKFLSFDGSGAPIATKAVPTGTVIGTTDTQTLTNKTIVIAADAFTLQDPINATKQLFFDASAIPGSTTVTLTSPSASAIIVGTDSTQVITNKDIDGGTASNSHRLTLPKNTKTNLDALTRKEATLVYASDLDKVYYDNGSALVDMSSSSGSSVKNYFINGDMRIAQRGTSFAAAADGQYVLDRYQYAKNSTTAVHTGSQDTDVPTVGQANYLFQNSLRLNLTTPDTSMAAGDLVRVGQLIEGYNWANLAQKDFTLSFWVKATATGTYCVSFSNTGNDRSYVAEYTVNTTATWEQKTIVVTASPSAGTWDYTNGVGLKVYWALAAGSTFQTTANAWQTGQFYATSNQVNGVNTGATDFRITGAMINSGTTAGAFQTFAQSFQEELMACQRYFWKTYPTTVNPGTAGTGPMLYDQNTGTAAGSRTSIARFTVDMRTAPSVTIYSPFNGITGNINSYAGGATNITVAVLAVIDTGAIISNTGTAVASTRYQGHATADAELS